MTFTLSVEGVDHWHDIIAELYQYIGMLRHYGTSLPKWIYQELESLQAFAYRFADEPSPEDLVEGIVEDFAPHVHLPSERLLDGNQLLFSYQPQEIQVS
jgi:secreted Zn-dependent insulinase-like peptidase